MGFRGSRVQIPPSRLSEDQALQRLSLWGFFFACTACCEFCCESGSAAHNRSFLGKTQSNLNDRCFLAKVVIDAESVRTTDLLFRGIRAEALQSASAEVTHERVSRVVS